MIIRPLPFQNNRTNFIAALMMVTCYLCIPTAMIGQVTSEQLIIKTAYFKPKGLKPQKGIRLDAQIREGSGLVAWNGNIWTHNDSGVPRIFALDSSNGKILKTFDLPVKNTDWEDMSQDERFLYIGNFGNNGGNRESLQIYRISKEALLQDKIVLDSITFDWPAMNDEGEKHKINFDCEAMAVIKDTIFLFTKEWKHRCRTQIFKIPAAAGNYTAAYVATLKPHMLVTGASYLPQKKQLVLCGYTVFLAPRLLALSLPDSENFRDVGTARKIRVRKCLKQIEGVSTFDGIHYYLISEAENFYLWKNKPKLYKVKLK
jgi:hypothetical protein